MRIHSLTPIARYGIAILTVALAAAVHTALEPVFMEVTPLLILMLAVILSSWYGGLGPGLLAIVLSLLIGDYLFLEPRYSILRYSNPSDLIRISFFGFLGTLFSLTISKLRTSIKAEHESAEAFRLLVEGIEDYAIFVLDPQGRVIIWNSGAVGIQGYRTDEIIGQDFSIFFPPEDVERGKPWQGLEIAAEAGRYVEEGWRVRKDGSRFLANVLTTTLRGADGRLRGYVKVMRDVTVRRQAEDELRKSKQFVQRIVEISPGVINIYGLKQGKSIYTNRSIASTLGYDPSEQADGAEFIRSVMHPDDWQPFLDHLSRFARLGDDETIEFDFRMMRKNGEFGWFHSRHKVFARDEDGSVREVIGTIVDITERKYEEEKARFFDDLGQSLRPLADPEEIKATAARILGEYLGADRCAYAEIETNEEYLNVTNDYTRGDTPSVVGRFSVTDLGLEALRFMRSDRPYVVSDIEAEPSARRDLSAYRQAEVRALVCAPLNKHGHYVARMAVSQKTPRRWSSWEVRLITIVANRCWESVERARAVRNLRESDERYRAFIAQSTEAIWRFELEKPIPITLPEDEQLDMLYQYAYLAECNDVLARMYGYEKADQILGARIGDLLPRSDPQNIAHLLAFKRSGYRLTDVETHEVDRHGNTKYFLNNQTGIVENGAIIRSWGIQRDITELKRAEQALRESEERLRRISEASQDSIWEIDLKTNQLWWSEKARPLFGHGPGDLQPGLNDWYGRIHPEDADRVKHCFEKFLRGDARNWADEYRFRRADGAYVYILDLGRKFYDESGAPVRIAGAMTNITERRQAEEALRASEKRYRLLTELSPDGIVIVGADGTIHLANQSMLRMLNAAPDQVIGRNLFDFIEPQYLDHCRDCLAGLMGANPLATRVEAAFCGADGQTFPAEVNAVRFDWKGETLGQIIIHDISRRQQSERERERLLGEIEAERDRLRQILEQMPIGVTIFEAPSGRAIFHNCEAESLLRRSLPDVDDYQGYAQFGGLREDGEPFRSEEYPAARSILSGEVIKGEEIRYRRGDGTETFLSVDSAPIRDQAGRIVLVVTTFIDIGERKRAEESLRESEERFAKAFSASPDALVISRISDGVVLEANDSFISMSGYDRDEVIGKSTIDLGVYVHPADRQRMVTMLKEQNFVRDFEFSMRLRSGEERLVTFSAEPFELRGVHCWLTIARDITERKRAEEALRESEERFEKAFRASPDVLIITRLSDGVILEVNESWTSLFGFDREEVLGKSWTLFNRLVDSEQLERAQTILKEQNYLRDFEVSVKEKTGETRLVTISGEPLELRGEHCFLTIVHDITERKQAEEALRNSEEQMRRQLAYIEAIYATAPVGMCFIDTDGRMLSMNERLAEIHGKTVEDQLGRTVREAMPQIADIVEPIYRRVIETGQPILNVELSPDITPGVVRHFIVSFSPIKNGDERVLGINVVVMEITQRKAIEEELEQLLRQEKAAREEAEAANRMKDEFLATISHELRTPLTSILGWARMLTGGSLTNLQARHAMDVIAQSAQSQTRLIEDILDTSRIITGNLKLDARPVAIEQVFHAAIDVIQPSAEAKGVGLNEVVDVPGGAVLGDASRLQQALWNLLSNAVKFTNEGGSIEARLRRAEGQIEITISDTGIGIEPQFLPYVFERFRQADSASTREYGGLGLGLAITRHIVEMHGGGVSASSPGKGQGATFKIRLPLISASRLPEMESPLAPAAAPKAKEQRASENGHRLDGVRVLLVEDNPDTLDMLRFIFRERGAEVIAASSVDEALEALENWRPDALVSDIAMPDRDGYDLIQEIRSREPEQGGLIPAVAVTAYTRAEDRVRALAAGFQMHVAKPIDPDELIAVVASLTGQIHF
ncbi:MAG TPA: PAS domain S-box protein [Blastocatellia bacterium]|nr:PAS domain S-box protein [Blastocatellia bacterium]